MRTLALSLVLLIALGACKPDGDAVYQGYGEGECLLMAREAPGRLMVLAVSRGDQVHVGDLLFQLDDREATIARDQAAANLAENEAKLADLTKGSRPEEVAVFEAELAQAHAKLAVDMPRLKRRGVLRASDTVAAEGRRMAAGDAAADQ